MGEEWAPGHRQVCKRLGRALVVVKLFKHDLESLALAEITSDARLSFLIPHDLPGVDAATAHIIGRVIALHRPLI